MIDWLWQQTIQISSLILLLAVIRYLVLPKISASTWYLAWLCIPAALLFSTFVEPTSYVPQVARFTILPVSSQVTTAHSAIFDPLLMVWLAGVLLVLLHTVYSHVAFALRIGGFSRASRPLERIITADGQEFQVVKTEKFDTPFVSGFINPVIVLPGHFHEQFNAMQQAMILRHENCHKSRRDPLWNALAQLIVAIFWFNPVAWYGYKLFREAQELSCDEAVLVNEAVSKKAEYARALLSASRKHSHFFHLVSYGNKTALKARLHRVMCHSPGCSSKDKLLLGGLILVTAASSLVFAGENHSQIVSNTARLMPVMRVAPSYPATENDLEGKVTLSFDIETDGRVSNVTVIDSTLSEAFEEQARLAVTQWQYQKPQSKMNNVKVALDFVQDPAKGHTSTDTSMERILVSNQN